MSAIQGPGTVSYRRNGEADRRILIKTNQIDTAFAESISKQPVAASRFVFYTAPIGQKMLSCQMRGNIRLNDSTTTLVATPAAMIFWVIVVEREGASGTMPVTVTTETAFDLYQPEQNVLFKGSALLSQSTTPNTTGHTKCKNFKGFWKKTRMLQEGDSLTLVAWSANVPANVVASYTFILDLVTVN